MSSTALAAGIAQLLSLENNEQQDALNQIQQLKVESEAPPAPQSASAWLQAATEELQQPSAWLEAATEELYHRSSDLRSNCRRGSQASTRAGGSSADSTEFAEWSDGASDTTPRVAGVIQQSLAESLVNPEATLTTLKIGNIPRRCGKEELIEAIEAVGFGDAYDFFYLPLGPQSKKNHGYAFINFKTNQHAERFSRVFAGYPIRAKNLDVAPAPLQGLAQNVQHFSKTSAAKFGWMPNVILKV